MQTQLHICAELGVLGKFWPSTHVTIVVLEKLFPGEKFIWIKINSAINRYMSKTVQFMWRCVYLHLKCFKMDKLRQQFPVCSWAITGHATCWTQTQIQMSVYLECRYLDIYGEVMLIARGLGSGQVSALCSC